MIDGNQKKRTTDWSFILYAAVFLIVGAMLALGYMWLDMRSKALGARIKQLERERVEIQRRYDNELWKWERIISPSNIEEALNKHNIAMIWPDETNIVRLHETDVSTASLQDLAGRIAQLAQTR